MQAERKESGAGFRWGRWFHPFAPNVVPEGQRIYFAPAKVFENNLKYSNCGYVLNQGGPTCGDPFFTMWVPVTEESYK